MMSTPEQEMNEALDALEADSGETFDEEPEVIEAVSEEIEDVPRETIEDKPAEKPPGYLTYEEWVAKGKDPADFRGENAYKNQYESLKEVRELKDTMNHVVEGMETWKQQQNEQKVEEIAQARVDAVAELAQAEEEEDMQAALAAKDKINQIDNKPQPVQQAQPNPVISDFTTKNPIIDPKSAQYDADFLEDMRMIQGNILDKLLGGDRSPQSQERLSPRQISDSLKSAYEQTKELHPNKFVSPRNKRVNAAPTTKRPTQTNTSVKSKLKDVQGNSRNPRDTNAATELYDIIHAADPKRAETFAKNVTGEE